MTRKRRPEFASNDQTTAGQQESRDTGSIGDSPGPSGGSTRQPAGDAAGRQPYDRSGRKPRDFKRSGQIHSDTQDRTT